MEPQNVTSAQAMALAISHHQSGRLAEAEQIYRQILTQNPQHAEALHLLGTILGQKGNLKAAEQLIRKSLAIQPDLANAYFNLGEFCRRMGRPAEGLATILEGMLYRPSAPAYDNMAAALRDLHCDDAAIDAFKIAIKFDPQYAPAVLNLGIALSDNGRTAEAVEAFERAAALRPAASEPHRQIQLARSRPTPPPRPRLSLADINDSRVSIALSAAFTHLHRYADAIAASERTIQLAPANADPYINLGWLYSLVGRLDDADAACRRAISLNPQDAPAHLNLAVIRLVQADFARGWPLYEFRKQCHGFKIPKYPQPAWNGQPLNGQRILLWFEQGLGDTIQFLRYVPKVAALGANVLLAVQPELRRLVETSGLASQFVDASKPQSDFDLQCSLLSLPFVFKTDLNSIPSHVPYLKPPPDLIAKWAGKIKPYSGRPRIGLAWAGRPGHINDANRSMQLKDLAPLAPTGASFFSLQKWKTGFSGPDPSMPLIDWTDELTDLADTAALIANLDLVITIDSAVAHLAGAIAAPVWLLLPKAPDWRWLLDRQDSPWYPTMRIFRQEKLGEWANVMEKVGAEIRDLKLNV